MVHDPRVSHALSRLGGVYRDPNRVDRDAASLLKSSVGAHLTPIISEMVENNGTSSNVLVLQGTIAMHFRGNTYQQLVDMYLPAGYPNRPPVCFVRLASPNMYLKENHRHVGNDGKIYLPYLHEWNRQTHNLVELVVAMSSVFSADPPVFTRAATASSAQQSSSASATSTAARISPPPPPLPPPPPDPSSGEPPPSWQTQSEEEAIMAVEIAKANEAAEVARRAEAEEQERLRQVQLEKERQQELARQRRDLEQREVARQRQVKQAVETKLRQYLLGKVQECQQQVVADSRDAQRLEYSQAKITQQVELLTGQKGELERHIATVDKKLDEIKLWLEENKKLKTTEAAGETEPTEEMSIDDVVQASNPLQAQMIELSAENHALSDALYLVDQALYRGHVDAETHLKQVRKLAKRQFLLRAHLHKIQQVMLQASTTAKR